MQLLFSFDQGMRVENTLMQTLASQLSFQYIVYNIQSILSTLMQHVFSFDRHMRVEKTLMQTLASQLSSTLVWPEFNFTLADIHYRRIIRKTHQPSFAKKSFSGKSSGYKHSKHDHPSRRDIRVSQHNVVHSDLSVWVCVLYELSGKHQKRFVPRTNTSIHHVILASSSG
jgi:hypothetical protein